MPRNPHWILRRSSTAAASDVSCGDDYVQHKKHILSTMCVRWRSKARHGIRRHNVCGVRFRRSLPSFVARWRGTVQWVQTDSKPKTRRVCVRGGVL
jgi:hypothetical protein